MEVFLHPNAIKSNVANVKKANTELWKEARDTVSSYYQTSNVLGSLSYSLSKTTLLKDLTAAN